MAEPSSGLAEQPLEPQNPIQQSIERQRAAASAEGRKKPATGKRVGDMLLDSWGRPLSSRMDGFTRKGQRLLSIELPDSLTPDQRTKILSKVGEVLPRFTAETWRAQVQQNLDDAAADVSAPQRTEQRLDRSIPVAGRAAMQFANAAAHALPSPGKKPVFDMAADELMRAQGATQEQLDAGSAPMPPPSGAAEHVAAFVGGGAGIATSLGLAAALPFLRPVAGASKMATAARAGAAMGTVMAAAPAERGKDRAISGVVGAVTGGIASVAAPTVAEALMARTQATARATAQSALADAEAATAVAGGALGDQAEQQFANEFAGFLRNRAASKAQQIPSILSKGYTTAEHGAAVAGHLTSAAMFGPVSSLSEYLLHKATGDDVEMPTVNDMALSAAGILALGVVHGTAEGALRRVKKSGGPGSSSSAEPVGAPQIGPGPAGESVASRAPRAPEPLFVAQTWSNKVKAELAAAEKAVAVVHGGAPVAVFGGATPVDAFRLVFNNEVRSAAEAAGVTVESLPDQAVQAAALTARRKLDGIALIEKTMTLPAPDPKNPDATRQIEWRRAATERANTLMAGREVTVSLPVPGRAMSKVGRATILRVEMDPTMRKQGIRVLVRDAEDGRLVPMVFDNPAHMAEFFHFEETFGTGDGGRLTTSRLAVRPQAQQPDQVGVDLARAAMSPREGPPTDTFAQAEWATGSAIASNLTKHAAAIRHSIAGMSQPKSLRPDEAGIAEARAAIEEAKKYGVDLNDEVIKQIARSSGKKAKSVRERNDRFAMALRALVLEHAHGKVRAIEQQRIARGAEASSEVDRVFGRGEEGGPEEEPPGAPAVLGSPSRPPSAPAGGAAKPPAVKPEDPKAITHYPSQSRGKDVPISSMTAQHLQNAEAKQPAGPLKDALRAELKKRGLKPKEAPSEPKQPAPKNAGQPGTGGAVAVDGGADGGRVRRNTVTAPAIGQGGDRVVVSRADLTASADESAVPEGLAEHLTPYQRQGVALAVRSMDDRARGGFLLADGTGVGKTRQILAIAEKYRREGKHVVIFVPNEVIGKPWEQKNMRANAGLAMMSGSYSRDAEAMGLKVQLWRPKDGPMPTSGITVTTYTYITDHAIPEDRNAVYVFDESHNLKNATSSWSRRGRTLINKAHAVLFASATPADKPMHIEYLARIGILEGKTLEQAVESLGLRLYNSPQYGPKWVPMPGVKLETILERMADLFDRMTKNGSMVKREISLKGVEIGFRRLAMSAETKEMLKRIDEAFPHRATALMHQRRQQEPDKIPAAMEIAKSEIAAGRKVIFFVSRVNGSEVNANRIDANGEPVKEFIAGSRGTAELLSEALAEAGISYAELHGNADEHAASAVARFQAGEVASLVATIESGGTGIDLDDKVGDAPRTIIFITAPFNGVSNVQAVGRGWRLTTKSLPRIVYLFGDTEVDQWNAAIIARKMQMLGASVSGEVKKINIDPDLISDSDAENVGELADVMSDDDIGAAPEPEPEPEPEPKPDPPTTPTPEPTPEPVEEVATVEDEVETPEQRAAVLEQARAEIGGMVDAVLELADAIRRGELKKGKDKEARSAYERKYSDIQDRLEAVRSEYGDEVANELYEEFRIEYPEEMQRAEDAAREAVLERANAAFDEAMRSHITEAEAAEWGALKAKTKKSKAEQAREMELLKKYVAGRDAANKAHDAIAFPEDVVRGRIRTEAVEETGNMPDPEALEAQVEAEVAAGERVRVLDIAEQFPEASDRLAEALSVRRWGKAPIDSGQDPTAYYNVSAEIAGTLNMGVVGKKAEAVSPEQIRQVLDALEAIPAEQREAIDALPIYNSDHDSLRAARLDDLIAFARVVLEKGRKAPVWMTFEAQRDAARKREEKKAAKAAKAKPAPAPTGPRSVTLGGSELDTTDEIIAAHRWLEGGPAPEDAAEMVEHINSLFQGPRRRRAGAFTTALTELRDKAEKIANKKPAKPAPLASTESEPDTGDESAEEIAAEVAAVEEEAPADEQIEEPKKKWTVKQERERVEAEVLARAKEIDSEVGRVSVRGTRVEIYATDARSLALEVGSDRADGIEKALAYLSNRPGRKPPVKPADVSGPDGQLSLGGLGAPVMQGSIKPGGDEADVVARMGGAVKSFEEAFADALGARETPAEAVVTASRVSGQSPPERFDAEAEADRVRRRALESAGQADMFGNEVMLGERGSVAEVKSESEASIDDVLGKAAEGEDEGISEAGEVLVSDLSFHQGFQNRSTEGNSAAVSFSDMREAPLEELVNPDIVKAHYGSKGFVERRTVDNPPIVWRDAGGYLGQPGKLWMLSGHHRAFMWKQNRADKPMPVRIVTSSLRYAVDLATMSNRESVANTHSELSRMAYREFAEGKSLAKIAESMKLKSASEAERLVQFAHLDGDLRSRWFPSGAEGINFDPRYASAIGAFVMKHPDVFTKAVQAHFLRGLRAPDGGVMSLGKLDDVVRGWLRDVVSRLPEQQRDEILSSGSMVSPTDYIHAAGNLIDHLRNEQEHAIGTMRNLVESYLKGALPAGSMPKKMTAAAIQKLMVEHAALLPEHARATLADVLARMEEVAKVRGEAEKKIQAASAGSWNASALEMANKLGEVAKYVNEELGRIARRTGGLGSGFGALQPAVEWLLHRAAAGAKRASERFARRIGKKATHIYVEVNGKRVAKYKLATDPAAHGHAVQMESPPNIDWEDPASESALYRHVGVNKFAPLGDFAVMPPRVRQAMMKARVGLDANGFMFEEHFVQALGERWIKDIRMFEPNAAIASAAVETLDEPTEPKWLPDGSANPVWQDYEKKNTPEVQEFKRKYQKELRADQKFIRSLYDMVSAECRRYGVKPPGWLPNYFSHIIRGTIEWNVSDLTQLLYGREASDEEKRELRRRFFDQREGDQNYEHDYWVSRLAYIRFCAAFMSKLPLLHETKLYLSSLEARIDPVSAEAVKAAAERWLFPRDGTFSQFMNNYLRSKFFTRTGGGVEPISAREVLTLTGMEAAKLVAHPKFKEAGAKKVRFAFVHADHGVVFTVPDKWEKLVDVKGGAIYIGTGGHAYGDASLVMKPWLQSVMSKKTMLSLKLRSMLGQQIDIVKAVAERRRALHKLEMFAKRPGTALATTIGHRIAAAYVGMSTATTIINLGGLMTHVATEYGLRSMAAGLARMRDVSDKVKFRVMLDYCYHHGKIDKATFDRLREATPYLRDEIAIKAGGFHQGFAHTLDAALHSLETGQHEVDILLARYLTNWMGAAEVFIRGWSALAAFDAAERKGHTWLDMPEVVGANQDALVRYTLQMQDQLMDARTPIGFASQSEYLTNFYYDRTGQFSGMQDAWFKTMLGMFSTFPIGSLVHRELRGLVGTAHVGAAAINSIFGKTPEPRRMSASREGLTYKAERRGAKEPYEGRAQGDPFGKYGDWFSRGGASHFDRQAAKAFMRLMGLMGMFSVSSAALHLNFFTGYAPFTALAIVGALAALFPDQKELKKTFARMERGLVYRAGQIGGSPVSNAIDEWRLGRGGWDDAGKAALRAPADQLRAAMLYMSYRPVRGILQTWPEQLLKPENRWAYDLYGVRSAYYGLTTQQKAIHALGWPDLDPDVLEKHRRTVRSNSSNVKDLFEGSGPPRPPRAPGPPKPGSRL